MKCVILAGGGGNRMWPLSRKNYPKQFITFRNDTSLFQETIVRNIPYCDEFWVVTNKEYRYIVDAQLKVFQNLKYRCFCEETGCKTKTAVMLVCALSEEEDELFFVNSDTLIDEGEGLGYKEAVKQARTIALEGRIACIGVEPQNDNLISGFVSDFAGSLSYMVPENRGDAMALVRSGHWLWDTGMFMGTVRVLRQLFMKRCKSDYEKICSSTSLVYSENLVDYMIPGSVYEEIYHESIGNGIMNQSEECQLVLGRFRWNHLVDINSVREIMNGQDIGNTLQHHCDSTTILNYAPHHLVVGSDLQDISIIHTEDATIVTKNSDGFDTSILKPELPEQEKYFEEGSTYYTTWGSKTLIDYGAGYEIRKLLLHPGQTLSYHRHRRHTEQWSVVRGTVTVNLAGETKEYIENETAFAPIGAFHQIANYSMTDVILLETSIGRMGDYRYSEDLEKPEQNDTIIRLEPVFKDNLWGGTNLRDRYGKKCDKDVVAESWELSAHEAGPSQVATGSNAGMNFIEYLSVIGKKAWGWKCQSFDRFPILVKFIDAKERLSIQVHPDDTYALANENEYGKNEMWYIMEAEPGACLYVGFNREVSPEELQERIENDTLLEVLNKVPVKKGQSYFIQAGTVHAIGAGIMICEIQQSSNVTYRIYDYGRRDQNGNLRELHVEHALNVVDTTLVPKCCDGEDLEQQLLCECKYFFVEKYKVEEEVILNFSEASFVGIVILDGEGTISVKSSSLETDQEEQTLEFKKADTFFIPARRGVVRVTGKCEFVRVEV